MENVEEAPPLSSESNSNSNNSSASSSSHQLSQSAGGAMGAEEAPSSSQSHSRSHSPAPSVQIVLNPIPNPHHPLNPPSEMEASENSPHDHSPTPTFHQTAPPSTTPSTAPQREEHEQQPHPDLQDQGQDQQQHPNQDQQYQLQHDQALQDQQQQQASPDQDQHQRPDLQEQQQYQALPSQEHLDLQDQQQQSHREELQVAEQPIQLIQHQELAREGQQALENQQQLNQEPDEPQVREPEIQPEAEPPPPLLLEELDEQDSGSQDLNEQQPAVIIEANAIAETIDANAVERIDDYEEDDEEVDEEEEVVEDRVDRAAEVPSVSGAAGQQRLHSVAVLPRYSAARAPRSGSSSNTSNTSNNNNNSSHNNNNNNNNNSSTSSGGLSRRTRHFYSNNGSHFSNDMFPSHAPRSSTQTSPRVGGRRQHSTPAAASDSPQHQGVDPLRLLYPNVNESETPLPRCWSPHDKCLSIGLSQNNLRVTYKGVGKQHSDAASVRTAYPIPSSCGLYYFEVRIISKGRNGYMGIGLTAQQFRMNRLPGWDKQSYGYHGDDGNSFSSSGNGQTYGPTFTTGDVIGCCVNFVNNTCFYTKNGVDLGIAFRDLPVRIYLNLIILYPINYLCDYFQTKLYPTVGLQTPGEEVDANFGQEPFKFDKIVDMMKEMRSNVLRKIDRYPHLLETPENLMNRLVSTYLVHNAFSKTAEAFNGYTNQSFDEDLASIKIRQKIIKLILTGKMSQAIEHTLRSFPGLLENNKNLWFALKCRQFIEMINGADIENVNNKVTATTQTMPTNQTSVIQSTKAFKHSKSGNGNGNGNGNVNINQTQQQQNTTAIPAVIKPQGTDKPDIKNMMVDDNSNKCVEHDSNSMDVEMEPCQSHSNGGDSCSNGNASAVRNSLDAIDEEMDVSPSSRSCGRVIEKILEFGKELSCMGQQLEKENLMTEEERQMLEDAFSLIAYSNPWSSPLGWLLCPSRRENVSTTLNSAILESLNCERRPPLEYLVAHAAELIKVIGQHSLGEDAFITIDDVFPQN
ncbi:ran-binding proteins 9/10 homolog isoform X2 [Drosophila gunungcola]|uniref:ran-binding proteins 9/10 homolog isoform X2 n=1 Tax=Drosophila gunungcola TaxID=103775 RepID=UPI0022E22A18|nr:ran-binding proteins 9/10 homolog isoform X2 [Drosophila gunungcola]